MSWTSEPSPESFHLGALGLCGGLDALVIDIFIFLMIFTKIHHFNDIHKPMLGLIGLIIAT